MQPDLEKEEVLREPQRRGRKPKSEAEPERRKKRTGGMLGRRLGVPNSMLDHEKFAYRWINDDGMRMYMLTEEDDWHLAPKNGVDTETVDIGEAVKRIAGRNDDGSPMYAYLCRKKRTFFDEDQKQKSAVLDEQLAQIRRGNSRHGEQQSDYIPHSGISVG